jgi:hypothetical protein
LRIISRMASAQNVVRLSPEFGTTMRKHSPKPGDNMITTPWAVVDTIGSGDDLAVATNMISSPGDVGHVCAFTRDMNRRAFLAGLVAVPLVMVYPPGVGRQRFSLSMRPAIFSRRVRPS